MRYARWIARFPALGLFAAALVFYLATLAPSVTWGDGARLQTEVMLRGSDYWFLDEFSHIQTDGYVFDRLGVTPWDHPLYVILGQAFRLLPWGTPPQRINVMSALAGALTVALVYRVAWFLLGNRWPAALGALALAVSHTFWFHAVTAEVYTLHTLFMISLIWLALRWQRYRQRHTLGLFALLAGLGLANHVMLVLTLAPALCYVILSTPLYAKIRGVAPKVAPATLPRWVGVGAVGRLGTLLVGLFLIGLAPWWIQFLRMQRLIGGPVVVESAMGFPWLPHAFLAERGWTVGRNLVAYAGLLLYQFTPVGVALGAWGWLHLWGRDVRLSAFLSVLYLIHVAFSANYPVADRFAFHLPSYLIFALLIAAGIDGLANPVPGLAASPTKRLIVRCVLPVAILAPIPVYAIVPAVLRARGVTEADLGLHAIGTGARDSLAYFLNPNKRGDASASTFWHASFAALAPGALVFSVKPGDTEAFVVMRYFQTVEGLRPDVHIEPAFFVADGQVGQWVLARAHADMTCRPLYLASLDPDLYPLSRLQADFDIVPEAHLYRLRPRRVPPGKPDCSAHPAASAGATLEQLIQRGMQ